MKAYANAGILGRQQGRMDKVSKQRPNRAQALAAIYRESFLRRQNWASVQRWQSAMVQPVRMPIAERSVKKRASSNLILHKLLQGQGGQVTKGRPYNSKSSSISHHQASYAQQRWQLAVTQPVGKDTQVVAFVDVKRQVLTTATARFYTRSYTAPTYPRLG